LFLKMRNIRSRFISKKQNYVNRLLDGKAKTSSLFASIKIAPSAFGKSISAIKLLPLS
jgi:hypothetical protein